VTSFTFIKLALATTMAPWSSTRRPRKRNLYAEKLRLLKAALIALFQLMTLDEIRHEFNESQADISYLKLDVETHELNSLVHWTEETLRNVRQMEIEFHVERERFGQHGKFYAMMLEALKKLHSWGFRPVFYWPNQVQEKRKEFDHSYHNYFDVLFVRR